MQRSWLLERLLPLAQKPLKEPWRWIIPAKARWADSTLTIKLKHFYPPLANNLIRESLPKLRRNYSKKNSGFQLTK